MNISPINNTSFGKLVLSKNKSTRETLRKAVQTKDTFEHVRDTFDKLDKISGDRIVEFSAYESSDISGDVIHVFCINKNRTTFIASPDLSSSAFADEKDTGVVRAMDELVDKYKKYIAKEDTKVSESELDSLFDTYSEN